MHRFWNALFDRRSLATDRRLFFSQAWPALAELFARAAILAVKAPERMLAARRLRDADIAMLAAGNIARQPPRALDPLAVRRVAFKEVIELAAAAVDRLK